MDGTLEVFADLAQHKHLQNLNGLIGPMGSGILEGPNPKPLTPANPNSLNPLKPSNPKPLNP